MEWNAEAPAPVELRRWMPWGLLLVGAYLALAALYWHRMFIDTEAWALCIASQPFSQQLEQIRTDLVHPPLMYLIQRGWLAVFGPTDNAAHALPLVIVSPAILLLTLLATRITAHWRLLSFFMSTMFLRAGAATVQVRMYGLALLLVAAGILLWDNWRSNPRNSTLAAWTAVMLLLVYTHLFGSLILFAFVVLNWLYGRRKIIFTLAAAVPAVALLPWLLYVLPVYRARGIEANVSWAHQNLLSAVPSLFFNFLDGLPLGNYRRTLLAVAVSAVIHLGLVVLFWLNRGRFWPPRSAAPAVQRWFWPAVVLCAIPVAILLGFSIVVAPAFESRFILGAVIPYSVAVFLICQASGHVGRIVLLCVLLPWKILAIGNAMYVESRPDAARQSIEFIAARARAGDLLLVENPNHVGAVYWEWVRRLRRTERIATLPAAADDPLRMQVLTSVPAGQLDLAGVERIWVFQNKPAPPAELLTALATRGFLPIQDDSARTLKLLVYERKLKSDN